MLFGLGAAAVVGGGLMWLLAPSDGADEAVLDQATLKLGVAPTGSGAAFFATGSW